MKAYMQHKCCSPLLFLVIDPNIAFFFVMEAKAMERTGVEVRESPPCFVIGQSLHGKNSDRKKIRSPAVAVAIREQLHEVAVQNVASARQNRLSKKGCRGSEHFPTSKVSGAALDLMKLFNFRSSVIRKRKEWDYYKPVLDLLSNEDVDLLEAREERSGR